MSDKNNNLIEKFKVALNSTLRVISDDFGLDNLSKKKDLMS